MAEIDEVVQMFVLETAEGLQSLDDDLVALEREPDDQERLASAFRTVHTIKGTCSFLGFAQLGHLAHTGENLLSRLRDQSLVMSEPVASALLSMADAMRTMLLSMETTGSDGELDVKDLAETLTSLAEGQDLVGQVLQETTASAPPADPPPEAASPAKESGPAAVQETTFRLDIALADDLISHAGELVLARNRLLQTLADMDHEDHRLVALAQQIDGTTTALQEGVMRTRMQPIETVWKRLPRMVRDLALHVGKEAELVLEGGETELDRSLVNALRDPLTHLVRNAIDHGLELPDEREKAGKARQGIVRVRAYHEGGRVRLDIQDDGAGMDAGRILEKAVDRGLLTKKVAKALSHEEAIRLIFHAGLSTAETVTQISGRGVGMDVVRTHIESVGGRVDIESEPGVGTTVHVNVPLTLAIVPTLLLEVDGLRFAVGQASIREVLRGHEIPPPPKKGGVATLDLRGAPLPLLDLSRLLDSGDGTAASEGAVIVVRAFEETFGLICDRALRTEDVVVKPLDALAGLAGVFSGATVLGDGGTCLILDVVAIAQRAGVLSAGWTSYVEAAEEEGTEARVGDERLVVLEVAGGRRVAIPVDAVRRLAELDGDTLPKTGHDRIDYEDASVPRMILADLLDHNGGAPAGDAPQGQVIVHSSAHGLCCLVVDRVLDIAPATRGSQDRDPDMESAMQRLDLVDGESISILDPDAVVRMVHERAGGTTP